MTPRRFFFIEPSKVGSQHITLIEGYLRALLSSSALTRSFKLIFCASMSTVAALSTAVREQIEHVRIPVMDPEKRRLMLKTIVECYVVTRYLLKMRRGDIVFVSCVLPTTLLFLELSNKVLRRRRLFIVLHGEIEGLFDKSSQRMRSFGFWALWWMRVRRSGSALSLVVIDDFIKHRLLMAYPGKLCDADILVVHQPISPSSIQQPAAIEPPAVCFVGYRTRYKGFDEFMQISALIPGVAFVAIGGGKVQDVRSAQTTTISGSNSYLGEISRCSAALFPYTAGYTCTLSGAVVDALSAGTYIVASDRPCFISLQEYFGADVITICRSAEEMAALFGRPYWLEQKRSGRAARLAQLVESKYGVEAVRASFERLSQVAST
jgi:glycosyltransferase involved in cell wall biosynthesis